jgi:cell division protein ZapA (FtsZ GTPase activity inhibitor)
MTETYNRFKVAHDILDAGNMRAIAREFVKVVDDAMEELKVTTQVWTDPAVVVMVTKLAELSNAPAGFSKAYEEVLKRRFQ